MPVNPTLATFSDTAFVTTFFIYLLALLVSIFHYIKVSGVIDARREHERLAAEGETKQELVSIAAGSEAAGAGTDAADSATAASVPAGDLPGVEALREREAKADKIAGMAQALIWLGIIIHVVSIVLRGLSTERFPFGNLYEYILIITAFAMITAAIAFQRKEWRVMWPWVITPMLALLFYGGTELYAAAAPVVPALQSFWFPIHVSTVSIGGAVGLVSGIASLLYLLRMWQPKGEERGFFGAVAKPLPAAKTLDGVAYKTAIITLPIFGLGVVLGAIWAEAAWGRFWGWDPKENGAALIVLITALILHARWGGLIRARGIMVLAVFGNVVTAWSWFGTNMLGVGLHSYGFIESAVFWLMAFVVSQLAIMTLGLLPAKAWRSEAAA